MGNIHFSHSVKFAFTVKGRWNIPVYYMLGKYIPFHFHNSPVVQVEMSRLMVEENEPKCSDSSYSLETLPPT